MNEKKSVNLEFYIKQISFKKEVRLNIFSVNQSWGIYHKQT